MNKHLSKTRIFVAVIGFVVGAVMGLILVEYWWQLAHPGVFIWNRPRRGPDYWLMAMTCSSSMAVLGTVPAVFRFLPVEMHSEPPSSQCEVIPDTPKQDLP